MHTFKQTKPVLACAWLPDGSKFVLGGIDRNLVMLDVDGREVRKWQREHVINDLAVSGACPPHTLRRSRGGSAADTRSRVPVHV